MKSGSATASRENLQSDRSSVLSNRQSSVQDRQETRQNASGEKRQQDRQDQQNANREDWQQYGQDQQQNRQDYASDYDDYHGEHPVAAGVAVGAVIGSRLTADQFSYVAPSCNYFSADGLTYYECGNAWYQQSYQGDQANYTVVDAPY